MENIKSSLINTSSLEFYGVRWKLIVDEAVDYYLHCERIGKAEGLSASSFDYIFPWSDIKRCNIKKLSDGTNKITYEEEADFVLDGSNGNVMVEIPKHYIKRYIRDGYEYRLIASKPLNGFIVDPAFVEDGKELEKIYVAAYEAHINSSYKMESIPGVYPTSGKTRPEFRNYAKANGCGYGILDIRTLLMLQNLFLIEHADRDSQNAIGGGWGKILQPNIKHRCSIEENNVNRIVIDHFPDQTKDSMFIGSSIQIVSYAVPSKVLYDERLITRIELDTPSKGHTTIYFDGNPIDTTSDMCIGGAAQKTGIADSIESHSGHSEPMGKGEYTAYRCAARYRYMENLWGNLWCYIDGLNLKDGQAYFCQNMRDYESDVYSNTYKPVAITQLIQRDNGNIGGDLEIHYLKNLGFDQEYPWLALPQDYTYQKEQSVPGASVILRNGNFGDYYYLSETATNYVHGGGFDHYWRCGLFTLRGWQNDTFTWYLYGSRMIYKPIEN